LSLLGSVNDSSSDNDEVGSMSDDEMDDYVEENVLYVLDWKIKEQEISVISAIIRFMENIIQIYVVFTWILVVM
jgi:hypothetical protein